MMQKYNRYEIAVLGVIGNDSFDNVMKLWNALEKKDIQSPNGLTKDEVVAIVKKRVNKAVIDMEQWQAKAKRRINSRDLETAENKKERVDGLMKFLVEKGMWDVAKQTFLPKAEWERLKDLALAETPYQVMIEQWLNKAFDAVNSRKIDEALLPGTESVARGNVAATYGALLQGSGTRPARLATPFRPWEKQFGLDWRSSGSEKSSELSRLSTIHATIRYVERARGLPKSCFVLEEAAGYCVVDVLDGSLNEKNKGHHESEALAGATAAEGTTRQPNFYVLEDGDILRFHHGSTPPSYSQLGMLRINILSNGEGFILEIISKEEIDKIESANKEKTLYKKIEEQTKKIAELKGDVKALNIEVNAQTKETAEVKAMLYRLLKHFDVSPQTDGGGASTVE